MINPPNIIGLIPARGGSRGIPKKNMQPLNGKPLLAWTVETALAAPSLQRVILSTDDEEIAEAGRAGGAEVPFLRPPELATDEVPDFPVFRHALDWLMAKEAYRADIVVWLRPTDPLRRVEDIEQALEILQTSDADTVRSVCPCRQHPYWMKRMEAGRLIPFIDTHTEKEFPTRQQLPPVYFLNGAVDVVRCDRVPASGPLFGGTMQAYVMPEERSLDIDRPEDLERAAYLMGRNS